MWHLLAASILWAFSFGLIKGHLTGLDPGMVACGRLILAAAVFAPFLGRITVKGRALLQVLGLGVIQFGLMYVLYIAAFQYLAAWMVALMTIFTPFYVVGLAGLISGGLNRRHLAAALLAVVGAGIVLAEGLPDGGDWRGVVLLQGANLCFAAGQVVFPRLREDLGWPESGLLAWMYQGAALFALVIVLLEHPDVSGWDGQAVLVLTYLGVAPTALGFYLWNKGAARTSSALLAAANNLKIPLAVLVSWLVFGEDAPYLRALAGMALITAGLILVQPKRNRAPARSP